MELTDIHEAFAEICWIAWQCTCMCMCVCMKSEWIAMMCVHAFVDVQACIFVSKCVGACV